MTLHQKALTAQPAVSSRVSTRVHTVRNGALLATAKALLAWARSLRTPPLCGKALPRARLVAVQLFLSPRRSPRPSDGRGLRAEGKGERRKVRRFLLSAAQPQPNGVRPSSGAETSDGNTCGSNPEPQTSLKLLRPGTAALRIAVQYYSYGEGRKDGSEDARFGCTPLSCTS